MSVLTFVCFTSLIYFGLADPIAHSASAVTSPEPCDNMKEKVQAVVSDMQKSVDTHLSCLFEKMDFEDKQYVEDYVIAGAIERLINYAIWLSLDQADPKSASAEYNNDVTLVFRSSNPYYFTGNADK